MTTYIYQDPENKGNVLVSLERIERYELIGSLPYTENEFFGGTGFGGVPASMTYDKAASILQKRGRRLSRHLSSTKELISSMKKLQT